MCIYENIYIRSKTDVKGQVYLVSIYIPLNTCNTLFVVLLGITTSEVEIQNLDSMYDKSLISYIY